MTYEQIATRQERNSSSIKHHGLSLLSAQLSHWKATPPCPQAQQEATPDPTEAMQVLHGQGLIKVQSFMLTLGFQLLARLVIDLVAFALSMEQ